MCSIQSSPAREFSFEWMWEMGSIDWKFLVT